MGFFRFRGSFKVLLGVRINRSKTGVSTSLGRPGIGGIAMDAIARGIFS
jgi:Protein of unknown function (DUF4236)